MADNDQYNDEYQFADLDATNLETGEETEGSGDSPTISQGKPLGTSDNNIKRKAVIVVVVVIVAMVIYKIVGSSVSHKKVTPMITPVAVTPAPAPAPAPVVQPQPTLPVAVAPLPGVDNKFSQKLSDLESAQQSMHSDVAAVSDQLGGISNNVNAVIAKMSELNGIIVSLSAKVDQQSRELEALTIRRQEASKVHYQVSKAPPYPKYHLQAVIPGRAWLIATNGATLTVREGTVITGYGMVRLIDPSQGRVTTSSGQVIKFSQEDS